MSDNDNERNLPNGLKLVFAPGCFDQFDGTQEELDALIKEIEEAFENGEAFVNALEVEATTIEDLIEETDPDEIEEIRQQLFAPRKLQ
jgi:hypothetical protein